MKIKTPDLDRATDRASVARDAQFLIVENEARINAVALVGAYASQRIERSELLTILGDAMRDPSSRYAQAFALAYAEAAAILVPKAATS